MTSSRSAGSLLRQGSSKLVSAAAGSKLSPRDLWRKGAKVASAAGSTASALAVAARERAVGTSRKDEWSGWDYNTSGGRR